MLKYMSKAILGVIIASLIIPNAVFAWNKPEDFSYMFLTYDDVKAYSDSSPITRAGFCALACKAIEKKLGSIPKGGEIEFSDTDNENIKALASLGIINGRGNGIFAPSDNITREEAAKILCKTADYIGVPDKVIVDDTFKDIDTVSDWAKEYVNRVGAIELMEGNGTGYDIYANGRWSYAYAEKPFYLSDSDFAPQATYTGEQSCATLLRMFYMTPVITGVEKKRQLDDITVYENPWCVWAEKDGDVVFCSMNDSGYYDAKKFTKSDGTHLLAIGKSIYNLDTGKRLFKFEYYVSSMNDVVISTWTTANLPGLGDDRVYSNFDYDGNWLCGSSGGSSSFDGSPKALQDADGRLHYIIKSAYLTKADSAEPIVSGKSKIYRSDKCEKSKYFVAKNQDLTYTIYDFDGNEAVHSDSELDIVNDEVYTRKTEEGIEFIKFDGGQVIASGDIELMESAEKYFTVKKDYDKSGSLDIYDASGKLLNVRCYSPDVVTDKNNKTHICITSFEDGERYTYYYNAEDMSFEHKFEGNSRIVDKAYYYVTTETKAILYDLDLNELMSTDNDNFRLYISDKYCVLASTYKSQNPKIRIYSREDFKLIKEINGDDASSDTLIADDYVINGEKNTDNYIVTVQSVISDLTAEIIDENNSSKWNISEQNEVIGVYKYDKLVLFNKSLEKIGEIEDTGSNPKWTDKYICVGGEVLSLDGKPTGLKNDRMSFHTVNGKLLLIGWNDKDDFSTVYDPDTLEELFTLPGQAWNNYHDNYLVVQYSSSQYNYSYEVYFDENGNQIEKPSEN